MWLLWGWGCLGLNFTSLSHSSKSLILTSVFFHLKNGTIVVLTSQGYCVSQDDACELINDLSGSAEGQCLDLDFGAFHSDLQANQEIFGVSL